MAALCHNTTGNECLNRRHCQRGDGTANVRFIAAGNRDLEKAGQEGRFSVDLFYRLNVLPAGIAPVARTSLRHSTATRLRLLSMS